MSASDSSRGRGEESEASKSDRGRCSESEGKRLAAWAAAGDPMAASGSSSTVAGLHGGRVIDLTGDEPDDRAVMDGGRWAYQRNSVPTAAIAARCHHGVMDDGRACSRTPVSMVTANVNERPVKQRAGISVIDLANTDSEDDEDDDYATKKRSLHRKNNYYGGKACEGTRPNSSGSPIRKRTRPLSLNNDGVQLVASWPTHLSLPSRRTRDGATITFGLLSLIDLLKDEVVLTCEGCLSASRNKILNPFDPAFISKSLPYNHQPMHIRQHDNWGCGFRNLQMLISAMMPTLNSIFPQGVPSVEDIQRTMEVLWSKGFDLRNAEHHEHSLVGKKTWIGTVEVWSYLSFKRVDSIIVQFIKTKENRAMLGKFVWSYFSRTCDAFGCSSNGGCSSGSVNPSRWHGSLRAAKIILDDMSKANNNNPVGGGEPGTQQKRCQCSLPPLYLQWDGHSVTVVGIKRVSNMQGLAPTFNLIVFCPQKNAAEVKGILTRDFTTRQAANGQYQYAELGSSSDKSVRSAIELPVTKLQRKDCQILMSTAQIIDNVERNHRKSCTKHVGFLNAEASKTK